MNDMTATPHHGAPLWNLADLYPTPDAWSVEYARIKKAASALDSYSGTLGKSAAAMLKALDAISRAGKETARLYTYAGLKADEDLSLAKDQERRQQAGALYTLLNSELRRQRVTGCTCRMPLPYVIDRPDEVSANWRIGTPTPCPHKCDILIVEIVAMMWAKSSRSTLRRKQVKAAIGLMILNYVGI
jgi:hypothetical protein